METFDPVDGAVARSTRAPRNPTRLRRVALEMSMFAVLALWPAAGRAAAPADSVAVADAPALPPAADASTTGPNANVQPTLGTPATAPKLGGYIQARETAQ